MNINAFLKKIKPMLVADIITAVSLLIIFFTTLALNKYIAFYILSLELLICSYFIAKNN